MMKTEETREGSFPVCLEREASLLTLLVHLHCCLPLYLMRRSLKKMALLTVYNFHSLSCFSSVVWILLTYQLESSLWAAPQVGLCSAQLFAVHIFTQASSSVLGMWQRLGVLLKMPASWRNFNIWEKRMTFIYCSLSKIALAMRNGCGVTSGWITKVPGNGWGILSVDVKHASHKVRKIIWCFRRPLGCPRAHGTAFLCWKIQGAPGELEGGQFLALSPGQQLFLWRVIIIQWAWKEDPSDVGIATLHGIFRSLPN